MKREIRRSKLENLVMREIGSLIITKTIKDPRIHEFLTVVKVIFAKDLTYAKVYIGSIREETSLQNAVYALNNAKGFIQGEIVKRIKVRNTPILHFFKDESLSKSFYVNKIIDNL